MASSETEMLAQQVSALNQTVADFERRIADHERRITEAERVNARLEHAALTTARALQEISGHLDAVYEAMRREEEND